MKFCVKNDGIEYLMTTAEKPAAAKRRKIVRDDERRMR
jgi:hypothetical protein